MTLNPKASRPHMPGYGLLPADQGLGLRPWSYAEERLSRARGYWISTTCPDGRPHSVPIWGLWMQDRFTFSTGTDSRKARNMRANPRVVIGSEPTDDAIVLEGEAGLAEGAEWRRDFGALYSAKYSYDVAATDPIYAVRPIVAFSFATADNEFLGGSTRWVF